MRRSPESYGGALKAPVRVARDEIDALVNNALVVRRNKEARRATRKAKHEAKIWKPGMPVPQR